MNRPNCSAHTAECAVPRSPCLWAGRCLRPTRAIFTPRRRPASVLRSMPMVLCPPVRSYNYESRRGSVFTLSWSTWSAVGDRPVPRPASPKKVGSARSAGSGSPQPEGLLALHVDDDDTVRAARTGAIGRVRALERRNHNTRRPRSGLRCYPIGCSTGARPYFSHECGGGVRTQAKVPNVPSRL